MTYADDRIQLAQNLRKMQRDCKLAGNNLRLVRATAYKSAVLVRRMLTDSMNELLADLRAAYPGVKTPVDLWLKDQFKPYVMLGGDYAEALRAVENKVPLKRFLALDFTIARRGTAIKQPKIRTPVTPPREIPAPPLETAPIEEKAAVYEQRAEFLDDRVTTLADQLMEARARIRELEQENTTLRRRLRQFEALQGVA